ncbi:hypothetical protein WH91_05290 [Devosia psychrophila]|uniref:Uncharacterized protein n=1 Tax=Devosia psychrophila TaxID=728005 RepID=A0A0F5PZH6_9HYPH|nr:hypothetical protein WH91_05290 [Devosia psychrophila]SFD39897.1 hypothetical protein SAMN04488059_1528 [Devosia psychrophila]
MLFKLENSNGETQVHLQFRREAVGLGWERNVAVAQIARDLDQQVNVLLEWVREQSADSQQFLSEHGQMKAEQIGNWRAAVWSPSSRRCAIL